MRIELIHPAIESFGSTSLAPRLPELRGRRIALLDNSHQNVDRVLQRIGVELEDRFDAEVVPFRKRSANSGGERSLLDEVAASAEAVVNGVAD